MRIPIAKVYRAFPELDPFDDAKCVAFVSRARRARRRRFWLSWLSLLVDIPLAVVVTVTMLNVLPVSSWLDRLDRAMSFLFNPASGVPSTIVLGVVLIVGLVLPPAMGFLWIRDAILKRAIRAALKSVACIACGFDLTGLPVTDGEAGPRVRCPECGLLMDLDEVGLNPADLRTKPTERRQSA
jgi:DNA-directed RNA polymerase subunit RPC12/RpoP